MNASSDIFIMFIAHWSVEPRKKKKKPNTKGHRGFEVAPSNVCFISFGDNVPKAEHNF